MITRAEAKSIVENNACFFCIEETVDGYPVEIYNYGLAGLMDFENPLKQDVVNINAWDMRSLCFVKIEDNWQRWFSLPKFFSLNQTRGYMLNDLKNIPVVGVYEKFDGSLITAIVIDNKVYCRSKNSFYSSQAVKANQLIEQNIELKDYIIAQSKLDNVCIFELIGVDRVVVEYDKIELRGLFLRNNSTGVLTAWENDGPENFISQYPTIESLVNIDKKNFEGVVALLADGRLVKSKTNWYETMHDVTVEKTDNLNRIIALVLAGHSDDAIASLQNEERKEIIREVETVVFSAYKEIMKNVKEVFSRLQTEDRKTLAQEISDKGIFGMACRLLKQENIDWDKEIRQYISGSTNSRIKAEEWFKKWKNM
jgi:T4 RnlA family RNA ligase